MNIILFILLLVIILVIIYSQAESICETYGHQILPMCTKIINKKIQTNGICIYCRRRFSDDKHMDEYKNRYKK